MFYGDDLIEEVRSRNDIVDVIGSYVNLKKKGNSYQACCPFHQEKTPSFHVSRDKQMYHCFGCGVGGNVFTFLMEYENDSFPEAMQTLADRAGITLPERELSNEERRQADEKANLKDMNKLAAGYFHYLLKSERGKRGYEYLKNRGMTDEMIKQFGLGYSDIYRDDLYQYLRSKGYTDAQLKDSALCYIDEKGASDRFWNRVMFPIMDVNSRVIGFGGRVLGDGEPKYLNSNDTVVFDKSRNLYGMHLAKKSKKRGIILCEGYMDVISMHQAGYDNAVASLGTAFTSGQANLLKRYTNEIYLAYDCDGAGVKAALRAIQILREFDSFTIRRIDLRPYKDPDELIQKEGVEEFDKRVEQAMPAVMYEISVLYDGYDQNDPASRTAFQLEAAKKLAVIEEPLERKNYVDSVARAYQIDAKDLLEAVNRYGTKMYKDKVSIPETEQTSRQSREEKKEENKSAPMKLLLTWMVNEPVLFERLKDIISEQDFYEEPYKTVAKELFSQYRESKVIMPASILNKYTDVLMQKKVAEIIQTDFSMKLPEDERAKAMTDVIRKIKLGRIEWELNTTNDMVRWQELIKEKSVVLKLTIGSEIVSNYQS